MAGLAHHSPSQFKMQPDFKQALDASPKAKVLCRTKCRHKYAVYFQVRNAASQSRQAKSRS